MKFEELPKVELHLHLDCSLSFQVAKQINQSLTLKEYYASFIALYTLRHYSEEQSLKTVELVKNMLKPTLLGST